jgi:hypothetical protein
MMVRDELSWMWKWRIVLPVTFATTLLLDACGISVDMARLREVSREVVFGGSSSISKSGVVSIVAFFGASHWK